MRSRHSCGSMKNSMRTTKRMNCNCLLRCCAKIRSWNWNSRNCSNNSVTNSRSRQTPSRRRLKFAGLKGWSRLTKEELLRARGVTSQGTPTGQTRPTPGYNSGRVVRCRCQYTPAPLSRNVRSQRTTVAQELTNVRSGGDPIKPIATFSSTEQSAQHGTPRVASCFRRADRTCTAGLGPSFPGASRRIP
jgi:hypothetical protein